MAEKYELAEADYIAGMKYKDIAAKYDVSINTVKSWKQRYKWSKDNKKGMHTKQKGVHTKNKASPNKKNATESVGISLNDNGELTDKQWFFCVYYTKYLNATKAYQMAYEVDYATASSISYRLMAKDGIKSAIQELKRQRAEGIMLDKNDVLQKYMDIAFADIGDYVESSNSGYSVAIKPLSEVDTSIISEVSNTENGVKIKLADKMKALDFLAKYTDLLNENEKQRLQEEKLKADIAKVHSETKGDSTKTIQTIDMSNLTTEELRAIANSKR